MKINNIFGTQFSGALGKHLVAVNWPGHEYIRPYVVASNPNTAAQREQRGRFAKAMKAWRGLSESQKQFYTRIADNMTGHNLFIRRYMAAVTDKVELEIPVRLRWVTADGQPIQVAGLMVKKGGRVIFDESLVRGEAEIALTPSDAPYSVSLRKGTKHENVWTIRRGGRVDNPPPMESSRLGVKLTVAGLPKKSSSGNTIGKRLGLKPRSAPASNVEADDLRAL